VHLCTRSHAEAWKGDVELFTHQTELR